MGTFIGHCLPGAFFLSIGLWHLLSCLISYARSGGQKYTAQVYFRGPGRLKYIELFLILAATSFDIFFELFLVTDFHPLDRNWRIPTSLLNDYEHSAMLFLFFLFALAALISESTNLLPLPQGALHGIVGVCFFIEFLLFHFHSANHEGLEAQVHTLLTLAIAACVALSWLLTSHTRSFSLDAAAAAALILQGTWFIQVALTLFFPATIPLGCAHQLDLPDGTDGSTTCEDEMATHRAMAIVNLLFSCHVAVILAFTLVAFAVVTVVCKPKGCQYEMMTEEDSEDFKNSSHVQLAALDRMGLRDGLDSP